MSSETRSDRAARTRRIVGRILLALTGLSTIGCDQITKNVATMALSRQPPLSFLQDTLRLVYVENSGGFLGLGSALPDPARSALFIVAPALMMSAVLLVAARDGWSGLAALGLALFTAGGLSNWIDRVVYGSVVDFLNVGIGPIRTGVFNVADMAIVLGAGLFVLDRGGRTEERRGSGASPAEEEVEGDRR